MKFTAVALLFTGASAFQIAQPSRGSQRVLSLSSTVGDYASPSIDVSTTLAKTELLETAESLNEEFGCLIVDSNAKERLSAAVEKLESFSDAPLSSAELIGEWTLLCSTASASLQGPLEQINGIDTSKLPFFNEGPIKSIRDTLNKSLRVEQIVKAESSPGIVTRIDHVLQYAPPGTLSEFLEDLPDPLKALNINPLEVTKSKVILSHKAEVSSIEPTLKTKLSLASVILNVAGKSQKLDPDGADVLGINIPFGEFLNAGDFETTYMDDKIRISRSKVGIVEQLRVFVRSNLQDAMQSQTVEDDMITDADLVTDDEADDSSSDESSDDDDGEEADVDDISPSDY